MKRHLFFHARVGDAQNRTTFHNERASHPPLSLPPSLPRSPRKAMQHILIFVNYVDPRRRMETKKMKSVVDPARPRRIDRNFALDCRARGYTCTHVAHNRWRTTRAETTRRPLPTAPKTRLVPLPVSKKSLPNAHAMGTRMFCLRSKVLRARATMTTMNNERSNKRRGAMRGARHRCVMNERGSKRGSFCVRSLAVVLMCFQVGRMSWLQNWLCFLFAYKFLPRHHFRIAARSAG